MDGFIFEGVLKAREVLAECSTRYGLYASGGNEGYTQVWARDSCVSMIGASFNTPDFKKTFEKSLLTLKSKQSMRGQIPNAVDFIGSIEKPVTYATIDSSLWYVLGHHFYKKHFGKALWRKCSDSINKAMHWVSCQDAGEDWLPEQLPTTDWQDCFPHRYGHTINTQAIYFACLKATKKSEAIKVRKAANFYLWDESLGYYLPWRWKDHGKYSEKGDWFDSLGNMLAIVFGLADKKKAKKIISFVVENEVDKPYPLKAIFPPISQDSRHWQDYFSSSLAGTPNYYLNGGIWPYIGGFYIAALEELKMHDEAVSQLDALARANKLGKKEWEFNEWLNPITGNPEGGYHQAWSAGSYLLAFECVKKRKNLLKI